MEFTQYISPTILAMAVSAIVGLIVKAVQLQGKVDKQAEGIAELNKAAAKFEAHITNAEIHFNRRLADEVEKRQDDRMKRMEGDLHEIKDLVKEIAKR